MGKNLMEDTAQEKTPYSRLFNQGIVSGIGWAIGVTIGFVLISTFLVFILGKLGGLPLIGDWLADLVEATQVQLKSRTPVFR